MGLKTLQTFGHVHVEVGRKNFEQNRLLPKQPAPIYTVWLIILKLTIPDSRLKIYNQSYGFSMFSANTTHRSIWVQI